MACKNICIQYKPEKQSARPRIRYTAGQKYCAICEVFIKWDGLRCPCCRQLIRTKSKKLKKGKIRID